jgi:hypothetical protein
LENVIQIFTAIHEFLYNRQHKAQVTLYKLIARLLVPQLAAPQQFRGLVAL